MSTTFQKIPADEFAQRHGWRTSAVVHRIRAGIYDGVREDGTWYVLRDAPPDLERAPAGHNYTPPPPRDLPWPTVQFPILWTGWAWWVGFGLMMLPLVLGRIEEWSVWFGVGLIIAAASVLYEAVRTGVIRAQYVGPVAYRHHPVRFTIHSACHAAYVVMGVLWAIWSAFDLFPRAM